MAADARSQKRGRGKGSHGAVFTCIATPKKGQRAPQCFAESIYWLCWRTDGTRTRPLPTGDRLGRSEEQRSELQPLMRTTYTVSCLNKQKTSYSLNTKNKLITNH